MVGARVRYHSAERVVTELEYLANLNFRQINIADDLFTANQERCMAVCEEILKKKLDINWTSFARVDTVSEALLMKMKAAGCTAVSFGIESANPDILKTVKKGITLQQVLDRLLVVAEAQFVKAQVVQEAHELGCGIRLGRWQGSQCRAQRLDVRIPQKLVIGILRDGLERCAHLRASVRRRGGRAQRLCRGRAAWGRGRSLCFGRSSCGAVVPMRVAREQRVAQEEQRHPEHEAQLQRVAGRVHRIEAPGEHQPVVVA